MSARTNLCSPLLLHRFSDVIKGGKICIRISIKSIVPPSMSDYRKKMAMFPVQRNWKVTAFLTRRL